MWPGFVSNARRIDEVLFRGSADAPLVQRIGAWLMGLAAILVGIGLILVGVKEALLAIVLGFVFVVLGGFWIFRGCGGLAAAAKEHQRGKSR